MGNAAAVVGEEGQEGNDFLSKRLAHGCNLFVQDEKARGAFVRFLKSGKWVNRYTSEATTHNGPSAEAVSSEDRVEGEGEGEDKEATASVEKYNNYELPATTSLEAIQKILGDANNEDNNNDLNEIIDSCFSQSQLRAVLLASVFPLFLESQEYQEWAEAQTAEEAASADANPEEASALVMSQSVKAKEEQEKEERLDELFQPNERRIKDIVSQAIESVDDVELDRMLVGGDWLKSLMVAVEDLSLCVTLATAREERRGFPLVYVNKAFEAATGYAREEIVGQNCKFLQGDTAEPEQVAKLTAALASAKPVKVALTNRRKDGSQFMNLLAMKPVFDANGVYSYVIGVQYDITNKEASYKQMKTVTDLLSVLPNVLK